jgi:SH3-like domain-containing protein
MTGQGKRMQARGAALAGIAATLALGCPAWGADDRPTPSGLPVPRYVTLKFGEVNARAGPGDDHRLLWVYKVRSLPVQVVAETAEWRRVCDPAGGVAWVHRRTTDGRRSVMNTSAAAVPLHRSPKAKAPVKALLSPRSLAALDRCRKGWCKIRAGGVSGWVQASVVWGTAEAAQCR